MLVAALLTIGALWLAEAVAVPLVLGALVSFALEPLHARLVSWKVPRTVAAALVVLGVLGGIGLAGYALRNQVTLFVDRLPGAVQKLRETLQEGTSGGAGAVTRVQQAAAELKKAADEAAPTATPARGVTRVQVEEPTFRLSSLVWRGSMGAIGLAGRLIVIVFLVFYLLTNGDLYKKKLARIFGPSQKRISVEILNDITTQIERFLVARLIITFIVGLATWAAFAAMGVSQPAVWGVGAGVLNNIPYVGPWFVSIAAGAAGYLQFGTLEMAAAVGGVAAGISFIEGFVITPLLMGRAARMNAVAVFVGLSFWGWMWGIWGLLLAVPIMMVIKAVCDHVDYLSPVAELLSE
jgi:predicted PurR-regulated permease PerM